MTKFKPEYKKHNITPLDFEANKKVNWVVTLPEIFDLPSWVVYETVRPSITISVDEYGKKISTINPIKMTFVDPIGPSTTQRLWNLYIASVDDGLIDVVSLKNIKEIREELGSLPNHFDYNIELLAPDNVTVEKWTVRDCKIIEFNFGKLLDVCESSTSIKPYIIIQPKGVQLHY